MVTMSPNCSRNSVSIIRKTGTEIIINRSACAGDFVLNGSDLSLSADANLSAVTMTAGCSLLLNAPADLLLLAVLFSCRMKGL